MKKRLALLPLLLMNLGFGLDEYFPVEKGKTEVDVGYAFGKAFGNYDNSGSKKSLASGTNPMNHGFPLQAKYGIMSGLDAELAWTGVMSNKDAGDQGGFGQPDLAVKYANPEFGAGAFLDFVIPLATGNLDNPKPAMGLGFGALFGKTFGSFRAAAIGSYRINFENSDKYKPGNQTDLYFKPEFLLNEFASVYLGLRYDATAASEDNSTSVTFKGNDIYTFSVLPGWNAMWLKWLSTEVNVPVTLLGKNAAAAFGVSVNVYMTFPN